MGNQQMNAQMHARKAFDRSGAFSGATRFAGTAGLDIGQVFDLLGKLGGSPFGMLPTGEPIAQGIDNVMAKIKEMSDERGMEMPSSAMDQIRSWIKKDMDEDSVALYETDHGLMIFDRPVGGSQDTSDEASPLAEFLSTTMSHLHAASSEESAGKSLSPAVAVMTSASLTATELLRWESRHGKPPVEVAKSMTKLIDDIGRQDPVRFRNLQNHLSSYGVNLVGIASNLRTFARNPRADAVQALATELARLPCVIVNVLRDAKEDAKEAYEAAMAV